MTEPLADKLIQRITQATELYHRLVLLVAPAGGGKTSALQEVHERTRAPLVNVNLELSRRMLDLTQRQYEEMGNGDVYALMRYYGDGA